MQTDPTQEDLERFRRLVDLGLIYRRSDGALAAHPDLQQVPRRLSTAWDRPWTPPDDAELLRHAHAGASISAIADCMHRKRYQIIARVAVHGPPPAFPWTDAARRQVIGNCRTWNQAARALGRPCAEVQRIGKRLGIRPDPTLPVVRLASAQRRPEPSTWKTSGNLTASIEIGTQPADRASAEGIRLFGQLLRRGRLVLGGGLLNADPRLLARPRARARSVGGKVVPYGVRIRERDSAMIAAARDHVPMKDIARQAGMTRWGATMVLRRHGVAFTRRQDRGDLQERRRAVQAAMRSAPSIVALARQVGVTVSIAAYQVRQIDPDWPSRRAARYLAERRRARRQRIHRLRLALRGRHMSMAQAGRAAGIDRAQPSQILIYGPNEHTASRLAGALQVPAEWLMHGRGPTPEGLAGS